MARSASTRLAHAALDAERGLIALLLYPATRTDEALDAILALPEDTWTAADHALAWRHARTLRNAGESVCSETILWACRGAPNDLVLLDSPANSSAVQSYLRVVDDARRSRVARLAWTDGSRRLADGEDVADVAADVERAMLGLTDDPSWGASERTAGQALEDLRAGLDAGKYHTGLQHLDEIVRSLRLGAVVVITGDTGEGKTLTAIQIAASVVKQGGNVAYYSSEMPASDLVARIVAADSLTSTDDVEARAKSEAVAPEDAGRIDDAWIRWADEPRLRVTYRAGMRASEIVNRERDRARLYGSPDLVVIDYLQRLRPEADDARSPRLAQINAMSGIIKDGAISLHCPIIELCQPNRSWLEEKRLGPGLHHLSDSGRLEQDADVVISVGLPHRRTGNPAHQGKLWLGVLKQRRGATGEVWARVSLRSQRIDSLAPADWPGDGTKPQARARPKKPERDFTGGNDNNG